jgi:cyclic pyranopterin phosphate synthase
MLSFEETLRLCGVLAGLGIRKVKVTGGEPLVRKGAASFVRALKETTGIEDLTLTTNGLLLEEFLGAAGRILSGVNISLDTLNPARFQEMTRCSPPEGPAVILRGMETALDMGLAVKINCVPIRGINEEDLPDIAALARDKNIAVRFIELMPLGSAAALGPVPGGEVRALLEKNYGPLKPFSRRLGNGPAVYYSIEGFTGKIGFINALSEGFCETCNRLRLTSQGFLKPCLSSGMGLDLRPLLRGGAVEDAELSRAVTEIVAKKPKCHSFGGPCGSSGEQGVGMFRVGG